MRTFENKARLLLAALLLLLPSLLSAVSFPSPQGYVNDFADVITAAHERDITRTAEALASSGEIELAVVTVSSLEGLSIEEYGIELAEAWGIGTKEKDLGILLLLAPIERNVRIEVGYGLEGDLPDGYVGEILDTHIIPHLRKNDFSSGMAEGSRAIAATLAQKRGFELSAVDIKQYSAVEESPDDPFGGIIITLVVLFFILGGRRRILPLLLMSHMAGRTSRSGGFGGHTRGGGFGSSGFGGFSGGSFGGGGASRSF
jgi:uncharacterized protein